MIVFPKTQKKNSEVLAFLRDIPIRSWSKDSVKIPFANPNSKPYSIYKKALSYFILSNYNNIGLLTRTKIKKLEGTKLLKYKTIQMLGNLLGLNSIDGYITSGGTEGNLIGLWIAREYLHNPSDIVLLKTELTHYSIEKSARILNIKRIVNIGMDHTDSMSMGPYLLKEYLIKSKVKRVILVLTWGYTATGTIDNLTEILSVFKKVKKNSLGFKYYIHIDAAFGGFVLPFVYPDFNFKFNTKEIMSVSLDGHKKID